MGTTENTGTPEDVEVIPTAEVEQPNSAESRPKSRVRTAAQKAKEVRYTQDARARKKLEESQKEIRDGIRSALEDYSNPVEEMKPGAKKLLEARGITAGHILDTCYELGLQAAAALRIPANTFFWTNGVVQTQISISTGSAQVLSPIEDAVIGGELVRDVDLYALWDFMCSWRESPITFCDFKAQRRSCKTDLLWFGRDVLGKDFHVQPHQAWVDLLPCFGPVLDDLLPHYSQEDMKRVLGSVSEHKRRMLLCSRNSYKSTVATIWLLQAVLFCPDVRLLVVSETKALAKAMIRGFRSYWEYNPAAPTKFNMLFPEYMVPPSSGSELTFESPMAHLSLLQAAAESTSMDSTVAGNRADAILFDDPISNISCGNETQRKASLEKYSLMCKLLEVGSLGSIILGTPWHGGSVDEVGDMYCQLLKRNEEDEDHPLLFKLDPAFTVKDHARAKAADDLLSLEEADVDLLFPSRLSWKVLRAEMKEDRPNRYRLFRSQNLVEFVPQEDDVTRVTFTEQECKARIKPASFFHGMELVEIVASLDVAYSTSKFADFSCWTVDNIYKHEGKHIFALANMRLGRWKLSELGMEVARMIAITPGLARIVIEKNGPWESVRDEIYKACRAGGINCPYIVWRPTNFGGTSMKTKTQRIKTLESPLSDGLLYFVEGIPDLEQGLEQLVSFDGISKSSRKKNDCPDALSLAYETFYPRAMNADKSKELKAAEDAAQNAANVAAMQRHIFGSDPVYRAPIVDEPTRRGAFGIPRGLQGGGWGSSVAPSSNVGGWGQLHTRKRSS